MSAKGTDRNREDHPEWLSCSRMGFHMSQKPQKASEEEKKKRKRKKKSKQTITRAVAHIRLLEANVGKLSTLDARVRAYLELCQQYTTLFCQAESKPDKWSEPVYATELVRAVASGGHATGRRHRAILSHQSQRRVPSPPARRGGLRRGQSAGRGRRADGHLQEASAHLDRTESAGAARTRHAGQRECGGGRALHRLDL